MNIQLDTPNPAIPAEKAAEINTNNVSKLQKTINGTGIFVHKDRILNTATNFNSATFALVFDFECSFVSSGGFVEAEFQGCISNASPVLFAIRIIVDNDIQKARTFRSDSGTGEQRITNIWFKDFLGEGKHNIQIQAMTGGNVVFSPEDNTCEFQVREIKL